MKATVWTRWNVKAEDHEDQKPKCIFDGEISYLPHAGDYIVVRDGFAAEWVDCVIYDFVKGDVEIRVTGIDSDNEYGECLYKKRRKDKNMK